jgi:hypothetical protein
MALVYCLSALDKLVHDIITHEMIEIHQGRRPATPKYLNETISMQSHINIITAHVPPSEIIFEGVVRTKLSHLCFMDPVKLVDGLSLVWLEDHKWQVIAADMNRDRDLVVKELRNLYSRRNAIVHEADRSPGTDSKTVLLADDAERIELFISQLGEVIHKLVRPSTT